MTANKSTTFELEQITAVGCTTLSKNYYWRVLTLCLNYPLSFTYLFDNLISFFFIAASCNKYTA
jgi:hypothetical protein